MARPRHLWSGDWLRESAHAADELARRRGLTEPKAPGDDEAASADGPPPSPARHPAPRPAKPDTPPPPAARPRVVAQPPAKPQPAAATVGAARPARRHIRTRAVLVVVLALGIGTAAAIALGAFGAASPAVNPATAVFKLPEPWIGLASKSSPGVTGALVTQVVAGGPADQAGLHRGDVITAVNGQAITRPADVSSVIDAQPVGAEVLLQINRAGQLETVGVILAGQSAGTP